MVHQGQRLPLRLEAGDDLGGVHARLDDLEGDHAADRLLLLGHVDHAEAAFADLLQQLVRADHATNVFAQRVADDWCEHCRQWLGHALWVVHREAPRLVIV